MPGLKSRKADSSILCLTSSSEAISGQSFRRRGATKPGAKSSYAGSLTDTSTRHRGHGDAIYLRPTLDKIGELTGKHPRATQSVDSRYSATYGLRLPGAETGNVCPIPPRPIRL